MSTLVYWIEQPDDHPLHKIAKDLGFVRSGWVRPNKYLDHGTGIVDRFKMGGVYIGPDVLLPPDIPLIVNLEHFTWILNDGSGPVSAYDWLQTHRAVAAFMQQQFINRLVGEWGLRIGWNKDLNKLYRNSWTCGIVSIYRRDGWTDRDWLKHVTKRYRQTSKVGKPMQLDMSPIMYERSGAPRSDARPVTSTEWLRMLHVEKKLNPRWAGYWLRPDVLTDAEIEDTMRVMAKELG